MAGSGESPGRPAGHPRWEMVRDTTWRLVVSTVGTCFRNRVTGLAAEAAFFALLSLPPLIFGLAGSIGYVFNSFSEAQVQQVKDSVIELASRALTESTVDTVITPTLNDVLFLPRDLPFALSASADLPGFAAFHEEKAAAASLVVTRVSDVSRFGAVQLSADDQVIRFDEKGNSAGEGWINAGIYLLSRALLESIPADRAVSIEKEIFPA